MTEALYRQVGRRGIHGRIGPPPLKVALVVRARDQLAGDGPWHIEARADELEFLLGRLRASAESARARGAQPSPGQLTVTMNASDAAGMDAQLDILRVSDALMRQLRAPRGD